jgi:hypothetical protein
MTGGRGRLGGTAFRGEKQLFWGGKRSFWGRNRRFGGSSFDVFVGGKGLVGFVSNLWVAELVIDVETVGGELAERGRHASHEEAEDGIEGGGTALARRRSSDDIRALPFRFR